MIELSARIEKLLEVIFPDYSMRNFVRDILVNECGDNIPFCEDHSPEDMDRIRFSVLKLSSGDLNKLGEAVDLAKLDWRDLFMAAGFGYDTNAHNDWYERTLMG